MLTYRVLGAALGSLLLSGCLSGQTGSPDCVGATSCVCDTLYSGGALLRVHTELATEDALVAIVDEVLGDVDGQPAEVRVGDRIGGGFSRLEPCSVEGSPPPAEGAELFVLFNPGSDGGYPGCESETRQVCSEFRSAALLNGYFKFALPWEDELDFGAGHVLPRTESAALSSVEACWERFPLGPAPPCNDTNTVCSVSHPSSSPHGWPWAGAIIGLACVRLARRRARRSK